MGVSDGISAAPLSEYGFDQEIATIGVLIENDFERARMTIPEYSFYLDYENYFLERESLQLGLSLGGLGAVMLPFDVLSLLNWRKLCGIGARGYAGSDTHDLWIGTMH